MDKGFIRCEQDAIWPFTKGLQKMLKWCTITAIAYQNPFISRIPCPLKVVTHIIQSGARNDPVFDLILIIQPCNEQCFVTW
jgi:hypothetical protein